MSRRGRNAAIGGVLVVVLVAVGVGLFALRGADAPPPATLSPAEAERAARPPDEPPAALGRSSPAATRSSATASASGWRGSG